MLLGRAGMLMAAVPPDVHGPLVRLLNSAVLPVLSDPEHGIAGAREPLDQLRSLVGPQPFDPPVGVDPRLLHSLGGSLRSDAREVLEQDLHSGSAERFIPVSELERPPKVDAAGLQVPL